MTEVDIEEEQISEVRKRKSLGLQHSSESTKYTVQQVVRRPFHAWYIERRERNEINGFHQDLELAREYFETLAADTDTTGEEKTVSLGWICRCALMKASSRDVSSRIPVALLDEMVQSGIWSPLRGLGYVEQISDEAQRSASIITLTSYLLRSDDNQNHSHNRAEEIDRILEVIKRFIDAEHSKRAIIGVARIFRDHRLARGLRDLYEIAKEIAKGKDYSIDSVGTIIGLIPLLPSSLHRSIFESISTVEQPAMRARLLYALIPYLDESLLERACVIASNTFAWWADKKYETMVSLAVRMAEVDKIEDASF